MYQKLLSAAGIDSFLRKKNEESASAAQSDLHPFKLLRWFSILSFLAIAAICIGFSTALTHFLTREILQRDALLTSQFVYSIVRTHDQQEKLGRGVLLGQILDERVNLSRLGVDGKEAADARSHFYDHIRFIPDVLLANVFAPDRKIIWATNPVLIGKMDTDNDELEEVFAKRDMVSTNYLDQEHHGDEEHKEEQQFVSEPSKFFIESYIPLFDKAGEVVAVVEIYKEPQSLLDSVRRCVQLVWACSILGMVFLYLAMFWIIRRADVTLLDQQDRLLESETLCLVGEMSTSVAHGIRNPLASIRSSAELALDADPESMKKNAGDIITQVDRLGKWVRDLLVFSRPVSGEMQALDVSLLVAECIPNFSPQLEQKGISYTFLSPKEGVPMVHGNRALATQALSSVISNAIEAMPEGGRLDLELEVGRKDRNVSIIVSDTGVGMTPTQMDLVFKPFYTTKRNGLGLGMALVKRIMERFGGTIRLSSSEGKGTRVRLIFSAN